MKEPLCFTFGTRQTRVSFQDRLDVAGGRLTERTVTVFDQTTHDLFGQGALNPVILKPGEQNKTWTSVERIVEAALQKGLSRDDLLIGVGGGVVGDLTAFAASIYMRGCRVDLVPTTLIAMVDAALGGKTGIDFGRYKNMIGSFYPAENLRISVPVLASLPMDEYRAGLAEVIKTALLGDAELYALLRSKKEQILRQDQTLLEGIVERCIRIKGQIVEEDFNESGKREILNLGHTFGHALEALSGFAWKHGDAVAWGIGRALELGTNLGLTDKHYAREISDLLRAYGFTLEIRGYEAADLFQAMRADKKKRSGRLRFVLQRSLGVTEVLVVEDGDVLEVLNGM
jgi:3-dehydroquinate synthase